jgi:hypothetical protein
MPVRTHDNTVSRREHVVRRRRVGRPQRSEDRTASECSSRRPQLTATAWVRELSQGAQNDVVDAPQRQRGSIAGEVNGVAAENLTTVLALLDERLAVIKQEPSTTYTLK